MFRSNTMSAIAPPHSMTRSQPKLRQKDEMWPEKILKVGADDLWANKGMDSGHSLSASFANISLISREGKKKMIAIWKGCPDRMIEAPPRFSKVKLHWHEKKMSKIWPGNGAENFCRPELHSNAAQRRPSIFYSSSLATVTRSPMAYSLKHFRCNRRCDWPKETRSGYKPFQ